MAKTIPNEEKVFMVSKSTNTIYSGSAALKAMSEWYTMEDVSNTVKPYKVFTALLTQSGSDTPLNISSGALTIGITYLITNEAGIVGWDFTNVGAPNNEVGTYFIATGTTPANWNNGYLTYNTGAPVATVLENTIGNVWFTYEDVGFYKGVSGGLFLENKTVIFTGVSSLDSIFHSSWNDEDPNNGVFLKTYYSSDFDLGVSSNGVIYNAPIEIRVYN